jgi:hypothetical protein
MTEVKVSPSPSFSYVKFEIISPREYPVIVWLTEPGGRFIKIFRWPLQKGLNVTSLQGMQAITTGTYQIAITEYAGKTYRSHFIKNLE